MREFQSRTASGVRGARLAAGDEVISLSILHGTPWDQDTETREKYLRQAPWKEGEREGSLTEAEITEMSDREEFILTVCANGYGKRSSAFEYRRIGRGGQGITNIDNLKRNGDVVASFPAHRGEQLMLVTDQAKLIRLSVGDMRVIGRGTAGVRLFNVADNEHVVAAARIEESVDEAEADLRDDPAAPVTDAIPDADTGDDLADGGEGDGADQAD